MASSTMMRSTTGPLVLGAETEKQLGYVSAAVAAIGSVLPWASFLGASMLGIDGDGIFTLVLGLAVLAGIYLRGWDKPVSIGTTIAGGVCVLIPLIDLSQIASFGIYVTLLGGLGLVVAGQSGFRRLD